MDIGRWGLGVLFSKTSFESGALAQCKFIVVGEVVVEVEVVMVD